MAILLGGGSGVIGGWVARELPRCAYRLGWFGVCAVGECMGRLQ